MSVSADAPSLDVTYKLACYAGRGRTKLAPGKRILPGSKQIFRRADAVGITQADLIARLGEVQPGEALLSTVMCAGRRTVPRLALAAIRSEAARRIAALPPPLPGLTPPDTPYPVAITAALAQELEQVCQRVATAPPAGA